jgi:8-oxo-dGTP pyrophosphatase MutT (NUDIX family)
VDVVGALIMDEHNRVYAHRRSATRRLFPGLWDIVGGHVEPGETREQALARELEEETGWRLRRIEAITGEWDWTVDGALRHETDYLVEVDGDLTRPRLEEGKQDAFDWVGPENLVLMMLNRTDGGPAAPRHRGQGGADPAHATAATVAAWPVARGRPVAAAQ